MPKHEAPLPRQLTYVPIANGRDRGHTARVPQEPDGSPVGEVTVNGRRYVSQRGPQGWEYVEEPTEP